MSEENFTEVEEQNNLDELHDVLNHVCRSGVAIVDTMLQRGAIRGEELTVIGQLRDRALRGIQICEDYHSTRDFE